MRDAYWYARAIEILTTAPSWVVACEQLGLSAGAAKQLAIRLRAAGQTIPFKGKGGRPSVASVLARPLEVDSQMWTAKMGRINEPHTMDG